ncbi:MAG: hypothetical protein H7Y42_11940 [Chitinophagaceae bacterium]|nr:hypothetical protein [Chitinophagaceae bacterium]
MNTSQGIRPVSEVEMIEALKNRKYSAFEDFYDQYAPAFFGRIKKALYRDEVSADTLKDVFKTIWSSIEQYDSSRESLFTWAMRITRQKTSQQKIRISIAELLYCRTH